MKELKCPRIREQVCKPNSVHREPRGVRGWAIIPLGRTLPDGSSDLPGGVARRSAHSDGPPFARLPIWSCTARSLPGRACHQTRRCALTLSPCGPHRFTHHPLPRLPKESARWLVCSLLHLSSHGRPGDYSRSLRPTLRPAVSGLAALRCSDFPLPLAPGGTRGSDRPTCSQIRGADYSKAPLNTYRPKASCVKL